MKVGLTLEQLGQELVCQSEVKQDYLVSSDKMMMETYGGIPVLRVLDSAGEDCMEPLELNSTAHRQLSGYLRIPANYYERMLKEYPELLVHNVNSWLSRTQEVKMLRTLDGTARAILSNRYWCVDNLQLLQAAVPVIGNILGVSVVSCGLTDTHMYVKMVSQRLRDDVVPGDTVQYGVCITNSEVGMGAIAIQPLLYRLVCTNGMVVGEHLGTGVRRVHKGTLLTLPGGFSPYYPPGSIHIRGFFDQFQKALNEALQGAKFGALMDRMRLATQAHIQTQDLTLLLQKIGSAFGLREAEQDCVRNHLLAGHDMTLYGLSNAVTRYAQDVASYDRATHLEAMGYDIMTMPRRQWEHFNQIAAPAAAA